MGWAYGVLADGREVGYSVEAVCEHEGCTTEIDRGLSYLCGEMHGDPDEHGCGRYFCAEHLFYVDWTRNAVCPTCGDEHEEDDPGV